MRVLQAYCKTRHLSDSIKHRGVRFIDSRHRCHQIIEARSILSEMPAALRDDIFFESARTHCPLRPSDPKPCCPVCCYLFTSAARLWRCCCFALAIDSYLTGEHLACAGTHDLVMASPVLRQCSRPALRSLFNWSKSDIYLEGEDLYEAVRSHAQQYCS